MKSFLLLVNLIILEIFVFPMYKLRENPKILSRTTIHFLGIINSVYSTRSTLKNYNKFLSILVIAVNYFTGKFLISQFYDVKSKYFDSMHSIVIISLTIIPFVFYASNRDLEEFENGGVIKNYIHLGLSNIISVNQLFYFYKHFHLKYGNIVEYYFNGELLTHFIVDFFANSFSYVVNNLICFFLNPNKNNSKYLKNIFKKFMLLVLANIAFYSIYSFQMARKIFEGVNDNFDQPHNLILYNLLPKDLDQRFRVFLHIFNWFLFMR